MHKRLVALCAVSVLVFSAVQPASAASFSFVATMRSAAQARQVPLPLLLAIAYVNTRWEVINQPARDGGFLPMDITPSQVDQAASLSGHSASEVKNDTAANIDAGAAWLANSHSSGADLDSWRPAVIRLLGPYVTVQVFEALQSGESRTTSAGESITLSPQTLSAGSPAAGKAAAAAVGGATAATATAAGSDYPLAAWVPADPANYSTAARPHDYPVDMIIIHDIEGSYGSAIQEFQNPASQVSAHYVVSDLGQITQMVTEHDIAWHAGNWDYNTRAIGIEHEGFAWTATNWYTPAMYDASAHLAASICSRWGVPMDRNHVIGHYQVPDPDNPGLFGGAGHHTDPGGNWNWTYYMNLAQGYANALPSPPHLALDASAIEGDKTITVSWLPARSCHAPISGYTIVGQPGNMAQTLPASSTSATFTGLTNGATYTFTVTATNSDGQDKASTGNVVPGTPWAMRESLGVGAGSAPSVASWSSTRMDVFYTGTDSHLYHKWSEGAAWSAPEPLGGILTSAPAAVSWGPNRIDIFARGADQQLWHMYWGGTYWGPWEPLGGILSSAPAVASWSANRLDIFASGSDSQLWHMCWTSTGWRSWEPLGGILTSSPTVAAWSANRLDIFARGGDSAAWHRWWTGNAWGGWALVGGTLDSAPAVTSWGPNRLDLFALTTSGSIQHLSGNGYTWSPWKSLGGGRWLDDPAAIARQPGTVDLFGQGSELAIWHVAYKPV